MISLKETAITKPLWLIYLAGFLAYASIYLVRLNFSVASSAMEAEGILTKAQIGVIGSVFSFTYALAKVPNGYIGDRLEAKRTILAGLLIAAGSNFCIGLKLQYSVIALLWGINAFGQALLWGPLLRAFKENTTDNQFHWIGQTLGTSIPLGSILGIVVASFCAGTLGAAACFIVPAVLVFLIAGFFSACFICAPGHPVSNRMHLAGAVKDIFAENRFRQIIIPAMAHGIIKDNITVWLALYFVDVYGIQVSAVAGYVFLVPLLTMVGKLSYAPLRRILKNDYSVSISSFAACMVCAGLLAFGRIPVAGAVVCLGLISAMVAVINTHFLVEFPNEIAREDNFAFAASVMDLLTYSGAGLGSLAFGVLIMRFGFGSMFFVWTVVSAAAIAVLQKMKQDY